MMEAHARSRVQPTMRVCVLYLFRSHELYAVALISRTPAVLLLPSPHNQVTSTHVGMLVCGIFNASVASESMGEGFTFDMTDREWRRARGGGEGGEIIAVGGDTQFVVTR